MIVSIRHKGLRELYETGDSKRVNPQHVGRLRMQLAALDSAFVINDMNIPGYRLHSLKGKNQNRWSIAVDQNWRLTFEFIDSNCHLLDYEDYH